MLAQDKRSTLDLHST